HLLPGYGTELAQSPRPQRAHQLRPAWRCPRQHTRWSANVRIATVSIAMPANAGNFCVFHRRSCAAPICWKLDEVINEEIYARPSHAIDWVASSLRPGSQELVENPSDCETATPLPGRGR